MSERSTTGTPVASADRYNALMPGGEEMRPNPRVKLTYADFLLFPDDGRRHELIDGEHFVTPSPNIPHQVVIGNLYLSLRRSLELRPIGQGLLSPLDVVFSEVDVVEPDLLYVSAARYGELLTKQNVQGAPDLVVEVASPSTRRRDETIKRRLYERDGVMEYWFVDPEHGLVRVYQRDDARFAGPHELSREKGDTLRSSLFPDLALSLDEIFREPA